jgi:hypothetical protein
MGDLKEKYSRYGIQEWITLIFGVVILGIQVFRYATDALADYKLEIFVAIFSVLLIISPLTLLNLIRKARGLDPK